MKRLAAQLIGIDQGDVLLFSDYEDDGDMWTGNGLRERRCDVSFSDTYRAPPAIHLSMSLLDIATGPSVRTDVIAENVTERGFTIVFRTWEDSRIARIRVAWTAIGELLADEDWDLY